VSHAQLSKRWKKIRARHEAKRFLFCQRLRYFGTLWFSAPFFPVLFLLLYSPHLSLFKQESLREGDITGQWLKVMDESQPRTVAEFPNTWDSLGALKAGQNLRRVIDEAIDISPRCEEANASHN
jgi:hypothetical protein